MIEGINVSIGVFNPIKCHVVLNTYCFLLKNSHLLNGVEHWLFEKQDKIFNMPIWFHFKGIE